MMQTTTRLLLSIILLLLLVSSCANEPLNKNVDETDLFYSLQELMVNEEVTDKWYSIKGFQLTLKTAFGHD